MGLWELLTQTTHPLNKIQFQVAVKGAVEAGEVILDMLEPAAQLLGKAWWQIVLQCPLADPRLKAYRLVQLPLCATIFCPGL